MAPQRGMKNCEDITEGEAAAEPCSLKLLIQKGTAGASPSRGNDQNKFFTASGLQI